MPVSLLTCLAPQMAFERLRAAAERLAIVLVAEQLDPERKIVVFAHQVSRLFVGGTASRLPSRLSRLVQQLLLLPADTRFQPLFDRSHSDPRLPGVRHFAVQRDHPRRRRGISSIIPPS
jgi:hypothetical protein